jgi:hypothetical protein
MIILFAFGIIVIQYGFVIAIVTGFPASGIVSFFLTHKISFFQCIDATSIE